MKTFKYFLFAASLLSLLAVACKKPEPKPEPLTKGIITGEDFRKCACCGGLMITFSENPEPYAADFYIIRDMPANSGIDHNSKFPIYVKVKYSVAKEPCGNAIHITQIERKR